MVCEIIPYITENILRLYYKVYHLLTLKETKLRVADHFSTVKHTETHLLEDDADYPG
jgi:hypothetical protein